MKVERQILHNCFDQAKLQYKLGNKNEARDHCDRGIGFCASKKEHGMSGEDLIEGVRINLWLDRFWQNLENWELLL
jgi:hypothetical protein|tara:strand:- start:1680 stop:1907 length:228 start_codon:yes stop_codon:yes gene_type:complete